MKDVDIKEGNTLIAEFDDNATNGSYPSEDGKGYWEIYDHEIPKSKPEWLDYDKSWSWLMPVVRKCYDIWEEEFDGQYNFDLEYLMNNTLSDSLKKVHISSVYKSIIEFIKWYNNEST